MASKKASSIEEQIEDKVKELLKESKTKYYTKTEGINSEIDNALKNYPSKKGKDGGNEPDIKVFIETVKNKQIPVMIEAKGSKGDYGKFNADGTIEMFTKEGKPKYSNIEKFAVN